MYLEPKTKSKHFLEFSHHFTTIKSVIKQMQNRSHVVYFEATDIPPPQTTSRSHYYYISPHISFLFNKKIYFKNKMDSDRSIKNPFSNIKSKSIPTFLNLHIFPSQTQTNKITQNETIFKRITSTSDRRKKIKDFPSINI